jgi:hypothetical protein
MLYVKQYDPKAATSRLCETRKESEVSGSSTALLTFKEALTALAPHPARTARNGERGERKTSETRRVSARSGGQTGSLTTITE